MSKKRRFGVALAVFAVLALAWTLGDDQGNCQDGLLGDCPADAQGPAPDPGGDERVRQPVPPRNKGFGFNLGVLAAGDAGAEPGVAALRRVGATHYRFNIHWNNTTGPTSPQEPVPADLASPLGQAQTVALQRYDAVYSAVVAAGIVPVIILFDAPRWASTLKDCQSGVYAWSHPRECPSGWDTGNHLPHEDAYPQWRAWAAAVAKRYPQAVLEGPNEPDLQWETNRESGGYPQGVPPDRAAEIQCELHRALPRDRTLLSMSMSSGAYIREFVAHAKGCYDAFSFHPYPGGTQLGASTVFARRWDEMRDARRDAGDRTPVWVTETGVSSKRDGGGDPPDRSELERAADLTGRLYDRIAAMPDVDVVMFHTLRDAPTEYIDDSSDAEYWFGFFDTEWKPHLRACRFLQPGTPALGPCPAVSANPKRAAAKRKARCRKVTKRVRRNGRVVRRKVFVCQRKASSKKRKSTAKRNMRPRR